MSTSPFSLSDAEKKIRIGSLWAAAAVLNALLFPGLDGALKIFPLLGAMGCTYIALTELVIGGIRYSKSL